MSSNKSAVSDRGIATKIKNMSDTNLLLTITIIVFFVMYIGAIVFQGSGFLKPQTFFNILNQNATLIIVSCGMSIVMIAGGIDISVGGMVALECMCCAVYLDFMDGNVFVSVLISLAIGLAFGLTQGFLVAYLDIQPFIVTLAGMFFARGMTTVVYKEPFNVAHEGFKKLKETRILIPNMGSYTKKGAYIDAYIELGVVVALIIVIVMFCVLRWTKLGRSFYAVGGNSQSAIMLGINVRRTKFITHLISGVLAGIGGYVFFLYTGAASPSHATGMEMNAIAASIIGGTMLTGGVGNIIGTFFGVLSLSTIQNIVVSAGLGDAWWTNITIASMLCIFLVLQSVITVSDTQL
ncbi:MAG: sugar ABC transporter permease YjfF, partial [Lachnospiraceae bacterium]|nr:sugar ABC transporter permease YjfF [Lachnospiraceae bacterium]